MLAISALREPLALTLHVFGGQTKLVLVGVSAKRQSPNRFHAAVQVLRVQENSLRQRDGSLVAELVVQERQGLGRYGGHVALPAGERGVGKVEGRHHGRQEAALSEDVQTAAALLFRGRWLPGGR